MDIEASNLRADIGFVMCVGYQWLGESKVHCPSLLDYPTYDQDRTNDSKLLKDIHKVVSEADILVTYYGGEYAYDWPFLRTRMWLSGLPTLPPMAHVDLYRQIKAKFLLSSGKLVNVQRVKNLKHAKTPLDMRVWAKAMAGHRPEFKRVIEHCVADVKVTAELYPLIREVTTQHPRVTNNLEACRACGGKVQSRGYALATKGLKNRKRKVWCTKCGAWETRAPAKKAA